MTPACDLVIPIHNSLDAAEGCLRSVLAHTEHSARVWVIDDASDARVAQALDELAASSERVTLLRNPENLGYLRSVNRGLVETTAPYICLLNSDTIVTPGWLERLLRCAESDERIMVVNPLSNAAVNLTVQLAPGLDVFRMAEAVARISRRDYPDVVTAVGFCFLLKRAALERFGGFDEVYDPGYCEESDYCMQVTASGGRVVVADDAFVYHRGGASFGAERESRYRRNRTVFDQRWAARYEADYRAFMRRDPLGYVRAALERGLLREAPTRPAEQPPTYGRFERLWVMTVDAWRRGGPRLLVSKLGVAPRRLGEALGVSAPAEPPAEAAFVDPAAQRRCLATTSYTRSLRRGGGLQIGVLVYKFDLCGGVLAVLDLVNELVLNGHSVTLLTIGDEPTAGTFTLYTRPLVFRSVEALADALPELDVLVATFWPTAYSWLPAIRRRHPGLPTIYFLQDYEAWFYPEGDVSQEQVLASYGHAHARIVTSPWLQDKLSELGHASAVIPIGIDLRVFYPRPRTRSRGDPWRILIQARPDAPWRGFTDALEVLGQLCARRRDIEPVLFGADPESLPTISFPYTCVGRVHDRNAVARLYASCDVLFDPSHFQAFGLPALEAMACGVPTVVPSAGGILQFAVDGENCLAVAPHDVAARVAALERLLDDPALRARLVGGALQTAAAYSHGEMARRHAQAYAELVERSARGR